MNDVVTNAHKNLKLLHQPGDHKIKIIAKFYTIDKDCILAYYKINYPIQTCYAKIKVHYT